MIIISPHARKRMFERDISRDDVENTLSNGEELYEDKEGKFGNLLEVGNKYLTVIWRYEGDVKEVITAYWRSKKMSRYKFIE